MNTSHEYSLFGCPVPRAVYYITMVLCPGLARVICLPTLSRRYRR